MQVAHDNWKSKITNNSNNNINWLKQLKNHRILLAWINLLFSNDLACPLHWFFFSISTILWFFFQNEIGVKWNWAIHFDFSILYYHNVYWFHTWIQLIWHIKLKTLIMNSQKYWRFLLWRKFSVSRW